MAGYKLVFKESVSKDLRPIPKKDVARILQRMEQLQENPRPVGSEKLYELLQQRPENAGAGEAEM